MTMTSRSTKRFSQTQLHELELKASERLEDLLEYFGLEDLRRANRFYVGNCPVHGGDRNNAFNIFHEGEDRVGNWRCFTNNCHKHFHPTLIGFVRGVLSHTKNGWQDPTDTDKVCSFKEAVDFLVRFCGEGDINNFKVDNEAFEKRKFASQMTRIYNPKEPEIVHKIPREIVRASLDVPATYFVSRQYSKEVLDKYDVGLCSTAGKEMYMRATVPIYNQDYEHVIGCTGRSIFDMCPLCETYHNPLQRCPDKDNAWKYSKWKNSYGFKGEYHLYNYWFAKEHIARTGVAIIVEGPGDVWRLEEAGIHMSVATFGAHFTRHQRALLDKSGALALIILTDPDQAGRVAAQTIRKECENSYLISEPKLNGTDVGATSIKLIHEKLLPEINRIVKRLDL